MAASALAPIDIELQGVGHILRDRRLDVPPYQRGYAWKRAHVEEFWFDLRAAFGTESSQYFLGTVVLTTPEPGRSTIIDGQQRSATTLLMFTALRNEFLRRGDFDRAKVIERQYIVVPDLRTAKSVSRLTLNDDDRPSLEAAIAAAPDDRVDLDPEKDRLHEALSFLEARFEEEAKNAGQQWAELLFRWVEFLEHRARVITVDVSDEADAFLIFETLNARGRELTIADLLKNYLFGLARDDLQLMQAYWIAALSALEASADEEIFTTFVRHLWASRNGATRERELYARMKAAISSETAALSFGQELEDSAPYYAALLNSDHEFWREQGQLQPLASTLLRLGLEQNRPLLLAAVRRFDSSQLQRLLRALLAWSVRGLIVGGIGGGVTERAYAEAAIAISEGRAHDADAVFEELASVIPTDQAFREQFRTKRINRTKVSKYLLMAITQAGLGVDDPAVVPDDREVAWHLASVLPRNPQPEEWPNFPADEIGQWSLRLGNLFLEDASVDPEIFPPLASGPWSPDHVGSRQEAMAEYVVDLWPRRPT
jgi:hypothetical protein